MGNFNRVRWHLIAPEPPSKKSQENPIVLPSPSVTIEEPDRALPPHPTMPWLWTPFHSPPPAPHNCSVYCASPCKGDETK